MLGCDNAYLIFWVFFYSLLSPLNICWSTSYIDVLMTSWCFGWFSSYTGERGRKKKKRPEVRWGDMIAPWSVITPVCHSRTVNISSDRLLLLWENLCIFLFLSTAVQSNTKRSGENTIETFFVLKCRYASKWNSPKL